MNDVKIPILLLLIVLCGVGYMVYDKMQNPKTPVKATKKVVEIASEDAENNSSKQDAKEVAEKTKRDALDSFRKGDYKKTLSLLEGLSQANDYDIQHMLAYCYSSTKEYDRSIIAFEKALKIRKVPADGYSLGYLYEITGRYGAAAGLYEELSSLDLPPVLKRSVMEGIARIANYYPDNTRLVEISKKFVEETPDSLDGVVSLLKLKKYNRDFSDIDEIAKNTQEEHGENYSYNYALAQLYDEAGNYKLAVRHYKKCVKINPDSYTPFMDCYNALMKANETAAAVKALEYFLDCGQPHPSIFYSASLEANKLKRYKTALRLYIHAVCSDVKLQGKNDEGLVKNVENEYKTRGSELEKSFVNAFICYLNGDCKYAFSELERIKLDIENTVYKEDYELVVKATQAVLAYDKKRDDEQKAYERKLKAYEDRLKAEEEARKKKAEMAAKKKENSKNELQKLTDAELKEKVLNANKNYDLYIEAGNEFFIRGNNENAKLCYKLAMSGKSSTIVPFLRITRIYLMEKDYEKAVNSIEEAIKKEPDNVEALSFASTVYLNGGNIEQAGNYAEKAYSLNPENTQCLIAYSEVCIQNGNYAKANELINSGLSKEKNNIMRASLLGIKKKLEEASASAEQNEEVQSVGY